MITWQPVGDVRERHRDTAPCLITMLASTGKAMELLCSIGESTKKDEKEPSMVAHIYDPKFERLRQEDCHKIQLKPSWSLHC